ncbi:recombinase family protein [Litorimonas sp.]|uniref:recombinase family protein n=1 Tax=Litorimonas sp. TaxID=1892381 RepID=UPI003A8C424E
MALVAAKARGVKLGKNGKELARMNKLKAEEFALQIMGNFGRLGIHPDMSLQSIANILNESGIRARNGGKWYRMTVSRILKI